MNASGIVALSSHMQRLHSISTKVIQTTKGYSERCSYQELGTNEGAFLSTSPCCMSGTSFYLTHLTHWHDLTQSAADGAVYSCVSWLGIDRIDCMICVDFGFLSKICHDVAWQYDMSVFEALATSLQPWLGMGEKLRPEMFWSTWVRLILMILRCIWCQGFGLYLFQIKIHKSAQTLQDTRSKSQCL